MVVEESHSGTDEHIERAEEAIIAEPEEREPVQAVRPFTPCSFVEFVQSNVYKPGETNIETAFEVKGNASVEWADDI